MSKNQNGMALVESVLILVIVAILAFTGWYVYHARQNSNKNLSSAASTGQTESQTPGAANSTTLSSGTDNSSLQSDLNSIGASQNQAAGDSNSANGAVNDQQNEISVPTN